MDIEKVCLITFSPTHTSRRVGEAIVQGINGSEVSCVDVTLNGCGALRLEEDTVVVVTVPVYGGHVAPLALERLKALESAGEKPWKNWTRLFLPEGSRSLPEGLL